LINKKKIEKQNGFENQNN